MQKTYRSIFISDVHLGTRDCKADQLNNFLKHNTCETLYMVGDIIDAWRIQQNKWRWKQSHTNVVRRIMGHAKRGTRVVYVAGNHDEFLRPLIPYGIGFGMIESMACGTPVAAYPCQGPEDVVKNGVTGYMEEDLATAVHRCIGLNRKKVLKGSQRWTWDRAWEIFKEHLVSAK